MKKSFYVCPVRNATAEQIATMKQDIIAIEAREKEKVYWPFADTKQDGDQIGIRICRDNREAMFASDLVRVHYDHESTGSCFDFGMAFIWKHMQLGNVVIQNSAEFIVAPASPQFSFLLGIAAQTFNRPTLMQFQKRWE
ncbi:MAG: hypothetical protein AAB869_03920, partial [Patescibacteria group bacterium]